MELPANFITRPQEPEGFKIVQMKNTVLLFTDPTMTMTMILMSQKVKYIKEVDLFLLQWYLEGLGCGSSLSVIDESFDADYCSTKGEGCFDEIGDYNIPMNVCCCKGDM